MKLNVHSVLVASTVRQLAEVLSLENVKEVFPSFCPLI